MQIMLVFEIQIFVHQIQPVDFWFNISYSVVKLQYFKLAMHDPKLWEVRNYSADNSCFNKA